MADEIKKDGEVKPEIRPEDIQANNEVVKATLEAQDLNGHSGAGNEDIFERTGSALDKLREKVTKETKETEEVPVVVVPDAAAVKPEVTPKPDAAAGVVVPDATATPPPAKSEDIFKDIQLPPGARPKSGEAFGAIKAKAQQEIAAREAQIDELKKAVAERDAKLSQPVAAELTNELKELREFRAKFDVDADPKFKEFDTRANASREFIYAKLSENSNLAKNVVDEIKKYGGPENVAMERIFEAMKDPSAERLISSRLAQIEQEMFDKKQAQTLAKKNVGEYVAERQKAFETNVTQHNEATKRELANLTGTFEWMKPITPADGATTEQKALAEAHNKWVTQTNTELGNALSDDSPQMRAILLAGMARMFYLEQRYNGATAALNRLSGELKTANEKLGKFKGASIARLDDSAAVAGAATVKAEDKDIFSTRPGDALDAIRNRVIAERERAGA